MDIPGRPALDDADWRVSDEQADRKALEHHYAADHTQRNQHGVQDGGRLQNG